MDHHTKLNSICEVVILLFTLKPWIRIQAGTGKTLLLPLTGVFVLIDDKNKSKTHTHIETHRAPPVWVGGVATQQLSGAAYGVSNWVEQHSWRTLDQDLASGNQSHNPHALLSTSTMWACAPSVGEGQRMRSHISTMKPNRNLFTKRFSQHVFPFELRLYLKYKSV